MVDRVAAWIRAAGQVVVLTGAGVSAESGVPVFRGAGGLWRQFRPEDLATPEAFGRQPDLVWEWYLWRREQIAAARPNRGHRGDRRRCNAIGRASRCSRRTSTACTNAPAARRPSSCTETCGASAAPAGAGLPSGMMRRRRRGKRCAAAAAAGCGLKWCGSVRRSIPTCSTPRPPRSSTADVVLVVGTSSVVYPVAALPHLARRRAARIVEVNIDETPLTADAHAVLRGPAGEVLPALLEAL